MNKTKKTKNNNNLDKINIKTETNGKISIDTIKQAKDKILELHVRKKGCFTDSEKEYISNRLILMEDNFSKLVKLYNDTHEVKYMDYVEKKQPPQQKKEEPLIKKNNDIEDIEDQEPIPANKAEQLRMHDEDKRKIGMEGRSFNSGFHGYTSKEVKELEKLIPDIHIPVKIKGILSPRN